MCPLQDGAARIKSAQRCSRRQTGTRPGVLLPVGVALTPIEPGLDATEKCRVCVYFIFRHFCLFQVRKRSKACRAGLREADELVSINDQPCGTLSHAQAMELIDSSPGMLHIRIKRSD